MRKELKPKKSLIKLRVVDLIDWQKLKPYQADKRKSFEEFCYHVADRLYQQDGNFTPIDDSGGGDGVEFYITLPNGDEWGWQAKFFFPNLRLNVSNRKDQIIKSLETAIENHPNLKKWFLCTPTDFTTWEIKWFEELKAATQKVFPNLILEHWGQGTLNGFLSQPKFCGIKNYFFGELELNANWFKAQVTKQINTIGTIFNPDLHVKTTANMSIHSILEDSELSDYFLERKDKLRNILKTLNIACTELEETHDEIDWKEIRNKILSYTHQIKDITHRLEIDLNNYSNWILTGQFNRIKSIKLNSIKKELDFNIGEYVKIVQDFDPKTMKYSGQESEHEFNIDLVKQKSFLPLKICKEISYFLYEILNNQKSAQYNYLNIFGKASVGKTHISCNLCKERIEQNLPAILLLGNHFSSSCSLEQQILQILDIPQIYSWNDFLIALQTAAKAYKTKIPIVIDALEEALSMDLWKNELQGFCSNIASFSQIIFITTCRRSYRSIIWKTIKPETTLELYNFDHSSTEEAITKYFDYYKIKGDLTSATKEQLSDPIFLKIFCESVNPERKTEVSVYGGDYSLFNIFEEYLKRINKIICEKMQRHESAQLVNVALRKISKKLWELNTRSIILSEAAELIDSKKIADLNWPNSLTNALLENGLLIHRDLISGNDKIFFAYNLIGGYLIAKELIDEKNLEDLKQFIVTEKFESSLLSEDYSKLHPLHEDILRCFAILLPKNHNIHLFEITQNKFALNSSIQVLFEMSADLIGTSSEDLIKGLFTSNRNRKSFLILARKTMKIVGHPLNIEFWEKLLKNLPIADRDLTWTEILRENSSYFLEDISIFENNCKQTSIDNQRLLLEAKYCTWMLTSTVRILRDSATKALYWYGKRFPLSLFEMAEDSLELNDPYIPERMLAAIYGVTMVNQYDFTNSDFRENILPVHVRKIYDLMFQKNAPYATTHILSRDYARRLIKLASINNVDIITKEEQAGLEPPFKNGLRRWRTRKEKEKNKYRNGSGPIHMDFGNYTLGSLISNRANYDFNNPEYKKVRGQIVWRIYDLGYSHDLFSKVDTEIHLSNLRQIRYGIEGRIDRYGKKYSWIAFFELAGFRQDNSKLPSFYTEYDRIPYADIDPSFPDSISECEIVAADFLGDGSSSLSDWIENGDSVNFVPYLKFDSIHDQDGPWILLDGYFQKTNFKLKRTRFILPRGVLVKRDESKEIFDYFKKNDHLGGLSNVPDDNYTFAGEIPWCETFHENGFSELEFVSCVKKEKIKVKKVVELADGTLLGENEFLMWLLEKSTKYALRNDKDIEKSLILEKAKRVNVFVEEEKEIEEKVRYEYLIPTRFYAWESYHSEINKSGRALVLAKELARHFELCPQPQTFNMYEKNGKPASITVKSGNDGLRNIQYFIFIRQDLLEEYLEKNKLNLIWAIWGERQFASESIEELTEYQKEHKSYGGFKEIIKYDEVKSS